ncbi:MAG: hypothetical protein RTU30_11430 [Candidatus Thorarchaeota archaeon]
MDTAKDARVLVLEDALRRLTEIVNNRKLKIHIDYSKLGEYLKTAGALLYEVKYSYQEPTKLSNLEPTTKLIESITQFGEVYESAMKTSGFAPKTAKEQLVVADVKYSLSIINGFQEKLQSCGDDPAYAIDILAVEITQLKPVEGAEKLTECRCTDGARIWPIVTNLQGLKISTKLACAYLPPIDMMGIVSEAMFLGGDSLPESTQLGPLSEIPSSALDQARAQVLQITKRMI